MSHPLSSRVSGRIAGIAIAVAGGVSAGGALAQTPAGAVAGGFAMDRYDPAEAGSQWFSQDSLDITGRLRPAFGLTGDIGYQPQRLTSDGTMTTSAGEVPLVSHQAFVHLGAAVVLVERLRVGLELPLAVSEDGNALVREGVLYEPPSGGGVGDPRLSADVRVIGRPGGPFTAALGAALWVPLGNKSEFLGDGAVRGEPHLRVAGDVGRFTYAASLGYLFREDQVIFAGKQIGDEVTAGAAVGVHLLDRRLLLGAEAFGGTVTTGSGNFLGKYTTYLEALGGAHYAFGPWRAGAGIGPGLTSAVGVPTVRGLFTFAWAPEAGVPPSRRPLHSSRARLRAIATATASPTRRTPAPTRPGCGAPIPRRTAARRRPPIAPPTRRPPIATATASRTRRTPVPTSRARPATIPRRTAAPPPASRPDRS